MYLDSYQHLKNLLQYPKTADARQADYDKKRLERILEANLSRPEFLFVQHDLPASVQTLPITEKTTELDSDVVITGGITDAEDRRGNIYLSIANKPSFVDVGDEPNVRMSIDAMFGKSVAAAGVAGVQYFESPFILRQKKRLAVEIYQDTAVADKVSTVFTAQRFLTPEHAEGQFSPEEIQEIRETITKYRAPLIRYSTCKVAFAGGKAKTQTPKQDEPYLIHGFRATFTDALVNLGFDANNVFAHAAFPIWALASEPGNGQDVWLMLREPLPVMRGEQITFWLENTIDGVLYATDGEIEVLETTP